MYGLDFMIDSVKVLLLLIVLGYLLAKQRKKYLLFILLVPVLAYTDAVSQPYRDDFDFVTVIFKVIFLLIALGYFLVTHKKCLLFVLLVPVLAYIYYGYLFKIRDFPEEPSGESACYVYKIYYEGYDSIFLSMSYEDPAFYKIFDKKSKRCLYTSNFYDDHAVWPDNVLDEGFYSEDCARFMPPDELGTPQEKLRVLGREVLRLGKEACRQLGERVVRAFEKMGILQG